jgi:hypothetical protein
VANITVNVTAPGSTTTWGEDAWSEASWGQVTGVVTTSGTVTTQANASVNLTGIQLTSSIDSTSIDIGVTFELTGISLTSSINSSSIALGIIEQVTGISLSSNIGTATVDETILTGEGWGRGEWGEFAWGDNYSTQVTGQSLSTNISAVSAVTDVAVTAASQQILSITQGLESIQIDSDIFVFVGEPGLSSSQGTPTISGTASLDLTGQSLTTGVGQAVGGILQEVPVTGISASLTLGTFTLVQSTNESVTGQAMTLGLGTPAEIPQQIVGVTGQQLTSGIGSVSVTGTSVVIPTGISLTSSIGATNITAWAEIDLGVNNVWTEVDLAA